MYYEIDDDDDCFCDSLMNRIFGEDWFHRSSEFTHGNLQTPPSLLCIAICAVEHGHCHENDCSKICLFILMYFCVSIILFPLDVIFGVIQIVFGIISLILTFFVLLVYRVEKGVHPIIISLSHIWIGIGKCTWLLYFLFERFSDCCFGNYFDETYMHFNRAHYVLRCRKKKFHSQNEVLSRY